MAEFVIGKKYRYLANDTICTVLKVLAEQHVVRIMSDHGIELEVGFHQLQDLPVEVPAPVESVFTQEGWFKKVEVQDREDEQNP